MTRPGRVIAAPFFALVLALTSCADSGPSAEPGSSPSQQSSTSSDRAGVSSSAEPAESPEPEASSLEPSASEPEVETSSPREEEPEEAPGDDATPVAESSEPDEEGGSSDPAPSPEDGAEDDGTDTAVVARIIDGDTVELETGEVVRVTGIDTPERGECHFAEASDRMGQLVLGQSVTLTQDGEDADRYDRLLRYIDVDGVDAGLTLIQEGYAVARYDSRDGYSYHAREDDYIAAQTAAPDLGCSDIAPEPEPEPEPEPAPGAEHSGECAPGYSPCIPPYPPDLNCSDLDFPVYVTGDDPHGLDRDGDGVGCEGNG